MGVGGVQRTQRPLASGRSGVEVLDYKRFAVPEGRADEAGASASGVMSGG